MTGRRLGAVIPAAILIVAGIAFLLDNLNVTRTMSVWGVAWPTIMVIVGLWLVSSGPRFAGLGLFVLGLVFLGTNTRLLPEDTLSRWWPLFLIGGGVWLLFGWRYGGRPSGKGAVRPHTAETVDLNVVFGEVDRSVVSKNFRGGSVAARFAEANLDLRQAELDKDGATLDASATFGEVRVRVPPTWVVRVDGDPLAGEIADRRTARPDEGPLLVVKSRVTFGSLKIED